jgi:putative nucleotidyltransferase with HDIG domain
MNRHALYNRQPLPEQSFGLILRVCRSCARLLPNRIRHKFHGIGSKLTLLVASLITLLTLGTAFLVINIMNDVLLHSMLKRGTANAYLIASSAGYSILSEDRLALDNLAAQSKKSQSDLAYLAILDGSRRILAHSQLELVDNSLPRLEGEQIQSNGQLRVTQVVRNAQTIYEFSLPIDFAGHQVGEVIVGLNPQSLLAARNAARWRILFIASLTILCGTSGTLLLTRHFARPITQLSQGVERLKAGTDKVSVPILADDELGELTHNFNGMAAEIVHQRKSLLDSSLSLEKSYRDIVRILAGTLDARDNYTYGHSARVARLSVNLGRRFGLDKQQLDELEMACLLHDIGKIRIPDNILNKRASLDENEQARIKEHPHHGVEILALADSLHRYIPTVKHHHEWYNGQGYPEGLREEQIPLNAQIVAITDTYDAMTTSRPYREGLSHETAVAEILRQRGIQFSPQLTNLFIDVLQEEFDEVLYAPAQQ